MFNGQPLEEKVVQFNAVRRLVRLSVCLSLLLKFAFVGMHVYSPATFVTELWPLFDVRVLFPLKEQIDRIYQILYICIDIDKI